MSEAIASADGGQGSAVSTSAALTAASAPAAPVEPTSIQVSPAPTTLPAAAAPKWLEGADETTIGYVQNKGWNDPKQVLDGYRNLEKLLGADKANNAVIIPKGDADPKEWAAVYDRLGRPSAPDGYKVEVPPGGDANVQAQVLAKFHELGLTKQQGETLANWYNGLGQQMQQAQEAQRAAQFAQEDQAVKMEWGQAYTQNLAQAQNAARGLGLDAATIDKLSDALGHKGTMTLLQKIGSKMGEDKFISGDTSTGFSNAMTPGQAKAQIQSLMSDRDFSSKYLSGDTAARSKMEALHRYAYPEA